MTYPTDDDMLRLAHGGMAPRTVDRLLAAYGSPAEAIHAIERGRTRVSSRVREEVGVAVERRRSALASADMTFTTQRESMFPSRIVRYEGAPRFLFVRGAFSSRPSIGIVGTRTCTTYGTDLALAFGRAAARAGWTVVSGLARGIDGAAHRGAVAEGGHCTAVLGSGVDVVYPRGHEDLYRSILAAGGAICSEFPPGTPPEAWRFPTRNRIIAAMSDVLLVVEAGMKGGALITAGIALEYGVPVYAVPGDVDRQASVGTNLLIRDGAFPILGADDLGEVLDLLESLYVAPVQQT